MTIFGRRPPLVAQIVPVERTQYVDRHVTEQRAPTDDSVRLLREMEDRARAEVVKAVHVADQHFECVVHMALDAMSDQELWSAVFKLNGKQMTAEVTVDRPNASDPLRNAAFDKLQAEMARVISAEILTPGFIGIMRERLSTGGQR